MVYYRSIKTDEYEVWDSNGVKVLSAVGYCDIDEGDIYDYKKTKRGYLSLKINKITNHYIFMTDGFNTNHKISINNYIKKYLPFIEGGK